MLKVILIIAILSIMVAVGLDKIDFIYKAREQLFDRETKVVLTEKYLAKLATKAPLSISLSQPILTNELLNAACEDFLATEPQPNKSKCEVKEKTVLLCRDKVCVEISHEWLEAKLKAS